MPEDLLAQGISLDEDTYIGDDPSDDQPITLPDEDEVSEDGEQPKKHLQTSDDDLGMDEDEEETEDLGDEDSE